MIRFFLLAGGYGKRARPLSLVKPKPLFPLHGIPLIDLMLDQLQKKGLDRGFINLHYKWESIEPFIKNRPSVICFHEPALSGSIILSRTADFLGDDLLLVVNGDVYLEIPVRDMERIMRESGSDGILLVRRDATGRYATLNVQNDRYLGLGPEGGIGVVYTGVALFKKNVLEKIKQTNFFYILNQNNFDIRILYYQGIWLDLGDPRSYYDSNSQFRKHIHTNGDKVNSLSPRVTISPDSRVENSIVWENTVIRGASRISNSIMTGNMVLDSVRYANKIITGGGVFDL